MRHDLFRFSGSDVPVVAVSVVRWPDGGTHTGIVHHDDETGIVYFLDLQSHRALSNRPWKGKWSHVVPNLDDDALLNVAGYCRLIARRNQEHPGEIPYALKFDSHARFNPVTGELHLSKEGLGLTCSTFVLLVFESAEAPLVDFNGWKPRPDDDKRHSDLLDFLESEGVDPDHIAKVRAQLPCSRIRPEEVAAGMAPDLPATFAFAETAGRWILGLFDHNRAFGLAPS